MKQDYFSMMTQKYLSTVPSLKSNSRTIVNVAVSYFDKLVVCWCWFVLSLYRERTLLRKNSSRLSKRQPSALAYYWLEEDNASINVRYMPQAALYQ